MDLSPNQRHRVFRWLVGRTPVKSVRVVGVSSVDRRVTPYIAFIHCPCEFRGMTERPGEDATSAEIAQWMAEDFGEALAEGFEQAIE